MALTSPPTCNFGWPAPDFALPSTEGGTVTFGDVRGERGTLIIFMCNHCPYVLRILDELCAEAAFLADQGVGVAGICSNDARTYPQDSFENMGLLARERGFAFPYLHDAAQSIARAYGAACTPDFFGFNAEGGLQFRGRFGPGEDGAPSELRRAMRTIAETGRGPSAQTPSIGCSIKWKTT